MSEREPVSTAALLKYAQDVRAVLASGWCQDAFARDEGGREVHYGHPTAVCWCPVGAMHVVTPPDGLFASLVEELESVLDLYRGVGAAGIELWNDVPGRKVEHVLAVMDRVIRRLEAENV